VAGSAPLLLSLATTPRKVRGGRHKGGRSSSPTEPLRLVVTTRPAPVMVAVGMLDSA